MFTATRRGFTLVELIVTIAIIAVLTTIAVVSFNSSRAKARDVARVSSVNQVMAALQLYRNDNKQYPTVVATGEAIKTASTTYLSAMPANVSPKTDGDCPNKDYLYEATPSGYQLTFCLGQDTGKFKKGVNVCINGDCASGGQLTVQDSDGNIYDTVSVGSQLWLAQNLYTKTKPDGTCINGGGQPPCADAAPGDVDKGRYCSNDTEANCTSGGAFYTWAAAMNGSTSEGARGLCPAGWHIPTDAELLTLERFATDPGVNDCGLTEGWARCSGAGTRLAPEGSTGFNAQRTGMRSINGYVEIDGGFLWSSTQGAVGEAIVRNIDIGTDTHSWRGPLDALDATTVRCIKNL